MNHASVIGSGSIGLYSKSAFGAQHAHIKAQGSLTCAAEETLKGFASEFYGRKGVTLSGKKGATLDTDVTIERQTWKKRGRFGFSKKSGFRDIAHFNPTKVSAPHGSINIMSEEGGVDIMGAWCESERKGSIKAAGNVHIGGKTVQLHSGSDSSRWWGLSHSSTRGSYDECNYAHLWHNACAIEGNKIDFEGVDVRAPQGITLTAPEGVFSHGACMNYRNEYEASGFFVSAPVAAQVQGIERRIQGQGGGITGAVTDGLFAANGTLQLANMAGSLKGNMSDIRTVGGVRCGYFEEHSENSGHYTIPDVFQGPMVVNAPTASFTAMIDAPSFATNANNVIFKGLRFESSGSRDSASLYVNPFTESVGMTDSDAQYSAQGMAPTYVNLGYVHFNADGQMLIQNAHVFARSVNRPMHVVLDNVPTCSSSSASSMSAELGASGGSLAISLHDRKVVDGGTKHATFTVALDGKDITREVRYVPSSIDECGFACGTTLSKAGPSLDSIEVSGDGWRVGAPLDLMSNAREFKGRYLDGGAVAAGDSLDDDDDFLKRLNTGITKAAEKDPVYLTVRGMENATIPNLLPIANILLDGIGDKIHTYSYSAFVAHGFLRGASACAFNPAIAPVCALGGAGTGLVARYLLDKAMAPVNTMAATFVQSGLEGCGMSHEGAEVTTKATMLAPALLGMRQIRLDAQRVTKIAENAASNSKVVIKFQELVNNNPILEWIVTPGNTLRTVQNIKSHLATKIFKVPDKTGKGNHKVFYALSIKDWTKSVPLHKVEGYNKGTLLVVEDLASKNGGSVSYSSNSVESFTKGGKSMSNPLYVPLLSTTIRPSQDKD